MIPSSFVALSLHLLTALTLSLMILLAHSTPTPRSTPPHGDAQWVCAARASPRPRGGHLRSVGVSAPFPLPFHTLAPCCAAVSRTSPLKQERIASVLLKVARISIFALSDAAQTPPASPRAPCGTCLTRARFYAARAGSGVKSTDSSGKCHVIAQKKESSGVCLVPEGRNRSDHLSSIPYAGPCFLVGILVARESPSQTFSPTLPLIQILYNLVGASVTTGKKYKLRAGTRNISRRFTLRSPLPISCGVSETRSAALRQAEPPLTLDFAASLYWVRSSHQRAHRRFADPVRRLHSGTEQNSQYGCPEQPVVHERFLCRSRTQLVDARLEEQALVLLLGEPQSPPLWLGLRARADDFAMLYSACATGRNGQGRTTR